MVTWGGHAIRLLILGGTTEANRLAGALAGRADLDVVLSLAGRTERPVLPPVPVRIGGFGGVAGLVTYLRQNEIEAVVDATHPFATRMSAHAVAACASTGVPLIAFERPAWTAGAGDCWTVVPDLPGAVAALGPAPRRVFVTTGRLGLAQYRAAPQHWYLARTVDPPTPDTLPPNHHLVLDRGPFDVDHEVMLMRDHRIEIIVTKNSGGSDAKLQAARQLGLPVVMVERQPAPDRVSFADLASVLAWIEAHRGRP